jgi:hypothetical protein
MIDKNFLLKILFSSAFVSCCSIAHADCSYKAFNRVDQSDLVTITSETPSQPPITGTRSEVGNISVFGSTVYDRIEKQLMTCDGSNWIKKEQGIQGVKGYTGAVGSAGARGSTGGRGATGDAGSDLYARSCSGGRQKIGRGDAPWGAVDCYVDIQARPHGGRFTYGNYVGSSCQTRLAHVDITCQNGTWVGIKRCLSSWPSWVYYQCFAR